MSKIKCFKCGEFGHFARDCLKARDNANIPQESEQNRKLESMLDLENMLKLKSDKVRQTDCRAEI